MPMPRGWPTATSNRTTSCCPPDGAVLVDFGIARAIAQSEGDRVTRSGFVVGTEEYMSPEQAAGADAWTDAADLYSLGIVLFEAMAGRPPFSAPSAAAVIDMQQHHETPIAPDAPAGGRPGARRGDRPGTQEAPRGPVAERRGHAPGAAAVQPRRGMTDPLFAQVATALGGRYTLVRELGQGGMGAVFLGRDVKLGREVAIKVLPPTTQAYLGSERFQREVQLAARLSHPHIVPLFEADEVEGFLYYVMGYVEGESLAERLARQGPLALDEAIRITAEVGDALQYAHERGIIHRDIKPANILLSGGHALVTDFGIAKSIAESEQGKTLTGTGITVGTAAYMSPEQASGERRIDARSDVYALAAVLYEMLAGEPPFTGPNAQAVVARILVDAPRDRAHRAAQRARRTWSRRCSPGSPKCRETAHRRPGRSSTACSPADHGAPSRRGGAWPRLAAGAVVLGGRGDRSCCC